MKSRASRYLTFCVALLALCSYAFAQTAPADEPPASVAGKWIIYAKGPTGMTGTKSIELKQDGNTLSGHFKGPYQSGGLEGTIEKRHIVFHTKTRNVLTFRGRVEGERMQKRNSTFELFLNPWVAGNREVDSAQLLLGQCVVLVLGVDGWGHREIRQESKEGRDETH